MEETSVGLPVDIFMTEAGNDPPYETRQEGIDQTAVRKEAGRSVQLLVLEGFHGIEAGRTVGREGTEDDSDQNGGQKGDHG